MVLAKAAGRNWGLRRLPVWVASRCRWGAPSTVGNVSDNNSASPTVRERPPHWKVEDLLDGKVGRMPCSMRSNLKSMLCQFSCLPLCRILSRSIHGCQLIVVTGYWTIWDCRHGTWCNASQSCHGNPTDSSD